MDAARAWSRRENLALLTDLYELTMVAGYVREGRQDKRVCFEYFFRTMPSGAGFVIVAGLESFLSYLENLQFTDDDITYLRSLGLFQDDFFDYLRTFRPACTVRAMREGTPAFPSEPIVQVEGGLFECQLVETALLNLMNYETLIATKASRIAYAAENDPVMEFGLRRAQGPDGGVSGARAAYIGGCSATSNALAGKLYGIPVAGTHAHSWVMSFESELEAFRAFANLYPKSPTLLVDTYDTLESGVPNAITVFEEMRNQGKEVRPAIRLDSGDLARLSKEAHRMMAEAGFDDPLIVASNELEEDLIADLKRQGARVNAWGVGTHLITARDTPSLSGVYKLVSVRESGEWVPRMKTTSNIGKATDPCRKQAVRYVDAEGHPLGDVLYDFVERPAESGDIIGYNRTQLRAHTRIRDAHDAHHLLETVVEDGRRVSEPQPVEAIRSHAQAAKAAFREEYRRLRNPEIYKVMLSERVGGVKGDLLANPEQW
jgi:nicotinate phosphoribosyltransferase